MVMELRRSGRVTAGKRTFDEDTDNHVEKRKKIATQKAKKSPSKKLLVSEKKVIKNAGSINGRETKKETKPRSVVEDKVDGIEHEEVKKVKFDEQQVSDKSANNDSIIELEIGDDIPDITLSNQNGKEISLKEIAKTNKIIVIFAFPRASTPGCTRQACGFRDNYDELKKNAIVFGLSADAISSQKKFEEKQHLPYDLLSDPKRQLIGLLGAKKTPQSGTVRSYWIFVEGKLSIKRIKVSPEISVAESKKEVIEFAKKLSEA
ncbi:thioredoxin peroxidase DOT5 NDAI_0H01310 [Naumovozyma dairenensis CBS 421]|uniref:thioredoxin-dependent peroxiredoxin n=1 Tax=Naumovozyma dairenensis (strain ATCC 10597 / BCRC 20456 / CBS 421 / NBRC 0211 / NRRL Y-12639) TaxID=1071378 RepID=G0WEU4_NAUDC|nr:hypothetical protein NDAI_0H01310 [Naumovozyma dairenensis CBS 421]CCD26305.1 hypothetical protein NDAI_0H01310 [Naumovozyma dairenensis CBS 421]